MRGAALTAGLTLCVALAAAPTTRAAGLVVQPLISRAAATRAAQRGLKPRFLLMRPEEERAQAERARLWRAFPDRIVPPGFRGPRGPGQEFRNAPRRGSAGMLRAGQAPPEAPRRLRVAILRIDFLNDRGGSQSTGDGRFDLSGPDTLVPPIDRPPHNRTFFLRHLEALRRYYAAQTYGQVVLDDSSEVWPRNDENGAYSVSDMADFGPWKFSPDIYPAAVRMFHAMMFAADSQARVRGDSIPWHTYDRVVLLHAGSDLQSDVRRDSPEDIPTFTLWVADSDRVVFRRSGKHCPPDPADSLAEYCPIDRVSIIPETANQDGYFGAINGVLAHECGHLFFDYFDVYDTETGAPVVGYWSLMDSGNQIGAKVPFGRDTLFATGLLPPSVDAFQRSFFTVRDTFGTAIEWREPVFGATTDLRAIERHPEVSQVFLSSDEYLLLENRTLAPADIVVLDQDSTTGVVLGPKSPDSLEYDALLPGGGLLVWHVDEFTILSRNYASLGINSDPSRRGLSLIEADGLGDLGDPNFYGYLGWQTDPFFRSNNPTLSDTTEPNLIPNVHTRPHLRLDFLDDPDSLMSFRVARAWQLPGWPVAGSFPPGGPLPLAVDADGDRKLEVCWAGGDTASADSAGLFAVRADGRGLFGTSLLFGRLDRRPRPLMAALPLGEGTAGTLDAMGPAWFAASTFWYGAGDTVGGKVWLMDAGGATLAGWPAALPAAVTTPPVIVGGHPLATVFVGCADGRVYALDEAGLVRGSSEPLAGAVSGRLAVASVTQAQLRDGGVAGPGYLVAAGCADGEMGAIYFPPPPGAAVPARGSGAFDAPVAQTQAAWARGWPQQVGGVGFEPDFLWIPFDGSGQGPGGPQACLAQAPSLVAHHADRLWGFCQTGEPLGGWGRATGDTLVAALGAGDPDGDGFAEVLIQSVSSALAFVNSTGYPSPGWPRRATREDLRTSSPPLALDLEGDGRSEVVALNGSGVLAALDAAGKVPPGWPLATGVGAAGAPLAADLDGDGMLEVVAPDRVNGLYAYAIPTAAVGERGNSWTMMGGDPGRSSALPVGRSPVAAAPGAGPLERGSLKVYPNPARRRPVAFAYRLNEEAEVEFRILDSSGHQVAAFTRSGRRSDNLEMWEPGDLPSGLYLARLRFRGAGHEHTEVVPVGLLR